MMGLSALSGDLNTAFNAANILTGSLPVLQAPITSSNTLQAQTDSVINQVNGLSVQQGETATQFLDAANQAFAGQFNATNIQEMDSSVVFDLALSPTAQPTSLSIPAGNIALGPFQLSVPNLPSANLQNNVTVQTHVTVNYYGSIEIDPSATTINYNPVINYTGQFNQGTMGGVNVAGSIGLNMSPTYTLTFPGAGDNFVFTLPTPTVASSGTTLNLPLSVNLSLAPLPTLGFSHSVAFDLNDLSTPQQTPTTVTLNNAVVATDDPSMSTDGSAVASLTEQILTTAGGPLFDRLNGLIPTQVDQLLLGQTEVLPGTGVTLQTLLGGQTPIDLLQLVGVPAPVTTIIDDLATASEFANQLHNVSSDNAESTLTSAESSLGIQFPLLDNTIQTLTNLLTGTPVDIVTWTFNLLDTNKYPELAPLLQTAPDGSTSIAASIDSNTIKDSISSLFPSGFQPVVDQLLQYYIPDFTGTFYFRGAATLGIDTTFLTQPSANGLLDSFFIDSGDILSVSFSASLSASFPPVSTSGSSPGDNPIGQVLSSPAGQTVQNIGQQVINSGVQAYDGAVSGFQAAASGISSPFGLTDFGTTVENALGAVASGDVSMTLDGSFTLGISDGNDSDGKLTAQEIIDIANNNPLCLLNAQGDVTFSLHGDGSILGQEIYPVDLSLDLLSFDTSCSASSSAMNPGMVGGTPGSTTSDPFAEVNPQTQTLQVYGSSGNDTIDVGMSSSGDIQVSRNGDIVDFSPSNIQSITVDDAGTMSRINPGTPSANGGNDVITISPSLPSSMPVTVDGGSGDDFISSMDGHDQFFGGTVTFNGGSGNNILIGSGGNSMLSAGTGNSTVMAGPGRAIMMGGPGNDLMVGPGAGVTSSAGGMMIGGNGGEHIEVVGTTSTGDWTMIGNTIGSGKVGNNLLIGGIGNDTLIANNAIASGNRFVADTSSGGRSVLMGGPGNNDLSGGPNQDLLIGGWLDSTASTGTNVVNGSSSATVFQGNATLNPTTGRLMNASIRVTGADAGGGPEVKVLDAVTQATRLDFFAYDPNFHGGVRVAVGDVNGAGVPDIITGPGPGGGPEIKVFDSVTGAVLRDFMAFVPTFIGGVFVASADVNGDGFDDIIVGADAGGGPHVEVFSGKDGSLLQSFFAYNPGFTGGVRVAAGDVNGDGRADIITGAGPGGGPHVEVFSGRDGSLLRSLFAYNPGFTGGVYVAGADINGDGKADIVTGAGPGGGPHVEVFSGADGSVLDSFFAYDPHFTGGVRVGAAAPSDSGASQILTGPGPGGGPELTSFEGTNAMNSLFVYDPQFSGGIFVGGR
jgi:hypothetical protein